MDADLDRAAALAEDLIDLTARLGARADEDPFGNPVLLVALAITRRMDTGELTHEAIEALIRHLRDAAFDDRAARLATYVGGIDPAANEAVLADLARHLLRPDPNDSPVRWAEYRALVERTRFAAVFTAHPTFALPLPVGQALADTASGRPSRRFDSHRPPSITLQDEFAQAVAAIAHGRDAVDRFNAALITTARTAWPDRWTDLAPRPVILSSWVGYDTDGRTDIGWWDTLRLRLEMKRLQLARLHAQLAPLQSAAALADRVQQALEAVTAQHAACPAGQDGGAVARFAQALIGQRDIALVTPEPLLPLFAEAIAAAPEDDKLALTVARAGLVSHGLALAHTHTRLNAAQLHNVVRQRIGIADPPEDPSHRRALFAAINTALDTVEPEAVDFGGLLSEQASAARLMMTVAQIVKHVDGSVPVRFLIAETETGYTLLAALWLARLFGIEQHIEISPLFETAEALERGAHVLDEALRSPHYRDYLRRTGRLALQFGYSDSGRYVGQLAASYLIERLRLKIGETLERHGVTGVEVILFDTHGESIGRGAHPGSLADRLKYLSPTASRQALNKAGLAVREESAFQGGDGYLLFGTPELALATITRIAEQTYHPAAGPIEDPVYADPDFAADFFATIQSAMGGLVEDAGYGALLGAFGPALFDRTGSRPAARQSDGMAGNARIRHPRELRAIPNNAILQQLGWCANTLHGIGAAAARHPETFPELRDASRRFHRALDLAAHALAHSDIDVLRAVIATLDPGTWLDRAAHTKRPGRREALVGVARALERLGIWAEAQSMFRRISADHLALRGAWPEAPHMKTREVLLHALRLALIQRIWLLATEISDFSPRHGVTRPVLEAAILRLDIEPSLQLLSEIFPAAPDPAVDADYGEPAAPRRSAAYAREHREIFEPMRRLFGMVREIATAVTHEVGAFG
ncbi:MAG: phosphoenolpyruvate carboxylase [Rhodospirillales bacterium 69-11]|nr:phosphoenolpyruvate carboxylase [Rhodospirillales bacterium]OJW19038.1 MAG: phosphoenolpyruvate carboxylase [Rhodospirillales bacterium 69-11]